MSQPYDLQNIVDCQKEIERLKARLEEVKEERDDARAYGQEIYEQAVELNTRLKVGSTLLRHYVGRRY